MAEVEHNTNRYYILFSLIAALMIVTLVLSFYPMGTWNVILGLLIAGTQASLLALFFMHLKGTDGLTKLVAAAGLFWLAILFVFTLTDYITRHYAAL